MYSYLDREDKHKIKVIPFRHIFFSNIFKKFLLRFIAEFWLTYCFLTYNNNNKIRTYKQSCSWKKWSYFLRFHGLITFTSFVALILTTITENNVLSYIHTQIEIGIQPFLIMLDTHTWILVCHTLSSFLHDNFHNLNILLHF